MVTADNPRVLYRPSNQLYTTNFVHSSNKPDMPIFGEKPFTSITVKINQLCQPHRNADLEDESIELFVTDLIDLIKLQLLGAVEAARAIRKKIKYGNTVDEQILALSLLELLVLNSGPKIGQVLATDDKLLDLLRNILRGNARAGSGTNYDRKVTEKVRNLSIGWKAEFADLDGYGGMAQLWKSIPRARRPSRRPSSSRHDDVGTLDLRDYRRSPSPEGRDDGGDYSNDDTYGSRQRSSSRNRETSSRNRDSGHRRAPERPTTQAPSPYGKVVGDKADKKRNKKKKNVGRKKYADEEFEIPQINYKVEAPKIRSVISDCHTHTTALNNLLLALPEGTDPLNDPKVSKEFEKCRKVRRSVLRYLQFVGAGGEHGKSAEVVAMDEEFLGSLIVANEQLVTTFQQFDKTSGYTAENPAPNYDDSEYESDESYYLSESDSELVTHGIEDMSVQESGSRVQRDVPVKAPPPRPQKSAKLRGSAEPEPARANPPFMARTQSAASVGSENPFGDSNEVGTSSSKYY